MDVDVLWSVVLGIALGMGAIRVSALVAEFYDDWRRKRGR